MSLAIFCHVNDDSDWEDVELTHARHMVAAGKWRECTDHCYDDGARCFHCVAPCPACDPPEESVS